MSEYQYYEFRTINRQLSASQRAAVDNLSSHGSTTATSFRVDYNYGSFKHKPEEVLTQYFDAFFYIANWGQIELMFRYPKELLDTRSLEPYCIDERYTIDCKTVGEHVIVSFELNNDEGFDAWIEGEGMIDGLLALYSEIMQGDYRALYLAWLGAIQDGTEYSDALDDDTLEPPVPPGLDALSPSLQEFVELFEIDEALITAAAKGQSQSQSIESIDPRAALNTLSKEESIDFLYRLLQGETHLDLKLKQRIGLLVTNVGYAPTGHRTIGELLAAKTAIREQQKQAAAAAREVQRRAQMAALAQKGEDAWKQVEAFIEEKKSEGYKKAVELLLQLADLAREQKQERSFASRVEEIRQKYSRRSGLISELRRVQV